jgi:tetratricopeptide (TPR) repeat protein
MRVHSLPIITCLLISSCTCSPSTDKAEDSGEAAAESASLSFNRDARAFERALADIDTELAATRARAEKQPKGWMVLEKVANLHLRRARLSGSYDDYVAAQAALDQAFERAPAGAGPMLTRASLNFTLHRLEPIEADLAVYDKITTLEPSMKIQIEGLRGDAAFERGQYQRARELFEAALTLHRSPSLLAQLAQCHWRLGEFDEAERLYLEAQGMMPDKALESRAWVHLQLGLMDLERGRYDDAFEHYRDGTQILGGWWLLEEHIAEIAALKGMDAFALELYDEIIERTGKAEFIDAKAGLLARAGDQAGAQAAVEEATKIFEAELQRFPEASYGHALDHYLEFGPPERALELATANYQLRPGVPAMISLAEARLGVGDVAGAREMIDQALATTWVSAELSWVASQIYTRLGETERAAQLRAEAEALHPTIAQ